MRIYQGLRGFRFFFTLSQQRILSQKSVAAATDFCDKEIFKYLDVLVDGQFIEEKKAMDSEKLVEARYRRFRQW